MLWAKMSDKKKTLLLAVLFLVVFVFTRVIYLGRGVVNPDAVNWHYRTWQFLNGIKYQQFEKTYQHYHPGVTVMWISGVGMEFYKQVSGLTTLDHTSFPSYHLVAKIALISVQAILSLWIFVKLKKHFGLIRSFFIVTIFSLEPFFVGNSRLYHLDALFTLFVFLALIYSYEESNILSGLFLSLSFLTKSIGIGALVYVLGMIVLKGILDKDYKKSAENFAKTLLFTCLFTFAMFPALWKEPLYYLGEIFSEGERVGIRKGHSQFLFGKEVTNGGLLFYPLVFLIKLSPLTLISLFIFKIKQLKNIHIKDVVNLKDISLTKFMAIFYIGYFLVMLYPTKKIDRYMLPLFPFMAVIAVSAYKKLRPSLVVIYSLFLLVPFIRMPKYLFTYTSPLVVSSKVANNIIGQKSFGVGMFEVRDVLEDKYNSLDVGMIDTKPLKSIYPNSKVADIRVNGVSDYEVLVLGINEEMPEKVLESDSSFRFDETLKVNGLDYWRFYVKE